uniref:Ig-like domain-containing protein n=1 Tax=Astyanax mexicanus TaxID=7994 RepID=A0A8B9L857_ASTMX
ICWTNSAKFEQPPSIFAKKDDSVTIKCSHDDNSLPVMLWYQQKNENTSMNFIGYCLTSGNPVKEEGFKERFDLKRDGDVKGDLIISKLVSSDSAVYYCHSYCASREQAYFGAGTKLTVLGKFNKFNQKNPDILVLDFRILRAFYCNKRVTLVCLAEDFYPDHIDLAWYIDDKEESTGVAKDDSAKLNTDSNTYSISSRLSIPFKKWNQGNTYKCKVTFHYPKEKSNDGKWTTESSTRWESLTAPKRKSLHFFTFHRW